MVSLNDLGDRPPRALADGEVLDLGGKRVRHLDTPHVPHNWEARVLFEETTGRCSPAICSRTRQRAGHRRAATSSSRRRTARRCSTRPRRARTAATLRKPRRPEPDHARADARLVVPRRRRRGASRPWPWATRRSSVSPRAVGVANSATAGGGRPSSRGALPVRIGVIVPSVEHRGAGMTAPARTDLGYRATIGATLRRAADLWPERDRGGGRRPAAHLRRGRGARRAARQAHAGRRGGQGQPGRDLRHLQHRVGGRLAGGRPHRRPGDAVQLHLPARPSCAPCSGVGDVAHLLRPRPLLGRTWPPSWRRPSPGWPSRGPTACSCPSCRTCARVWMWGGDRPPVGHHRRRRPTTTPAATGPATTPLRRRRGRGRAGRPGPGHLHVGLERAAQGRGAQPRRHHPHHRRCSATSWRLARRRRCRRSCCAASRSSGSAAPWCSAARCRPASRCALPRAVRRRGRRSAMVERERMHRGAGLAVAHPVDEGPSRRFADARPVVDAAPHRRRPVRHGPRGLARPRHPAPTGGMSETVGNWNGSERKAVDPDDRRGAARPGGGRAAGSGASACCRATTSRSGRRPSTPTGGCTPATGASCSRTGPSSWAASTR